jgi:catechol 2,3-dioxygenase-like lactoylglutathione lyase family enzyme
MSISPGSPHLERTGSSLRYADDSSRVTLTVCTPRIVRVELDDGGVAAGPGYVGERSWPPSPFEIAEGDPPRLTTGHLGVDISTAPLRLAFLDPDGQWLLRQPRA